MAQIKDILSIKLEDDIKSVINLNSQSEEDILEELDGFILTESLSTFAIYLGRAQNSQVFG